MKQMIMKQVTSAILQKIRKSRPVRGSSHKGDFGKVLIIGGCEEYSGAPAMAANAAVAVLRSGADWVTVAAPEKVAWSVNCINPNIVTKKFRGDHFTLRHASQIEQLIKKHDVIAIGSGIGRRSDSFIRKIVRMTAKPKVIDADAIKAIRIQDCGNAILTPHKKELELMMKNSRIHSMPELMKKLGDNVLLLKGKNDIIMSAGAAAVNTTGNAVMTKAGTGDVLAGLCAGFLAMTEELFTSACAAAYVNGKVGDYLLKRKGRTFIATDLIENIYKVYK